MLIHPPPCVLQFVDTLNESLRAHSPQARLTLRQRSWLVTVLMGIVVTEKLCWASFERRGLNRFTEAGLRWLFWHAKLYWSHLLQASVTNILSHYGITAATLVIDDTDKRRAKRTSRIAGAHKIKDKKTGGYNNGQELVFLLLVTQSLTVPVDFRFYVPDPVQSAWRKQYQTQKQQGIPARQRVVRPAPNPAYPSKAELALEMLGDFSRAFPQLRVRGVLADALYGHASFLDQAAEASGGSQVVSELRSNQLVVSRGRSVRLDECFARQPGVAIDLPIRGQHEQPMEVLAARLVVKAHGKKRFVVAVRYEGEAAYRFLVATDLSWRHQDIIRLYSLRWLVEVFIQDWKAHGGWNRLAKQQGEEGSRRGVILSLLCDHLLLLHPEQSARLKNRQPGLPVGCLTERIKIEAMIAVVEETLRAEDPETALRTLTETLQASLPERSSRKHMAGLDLGRQEPTPSLYYRAAA